MSVADFDQSEWAFLPALSEADLPTEPYDPGPVDDLNLVELDDNDLLAALERLRREQASLAAMELRLLATISERDSVAERWSIEEIGAILKATGGSTRNRLAEADQLVHQLPHTMDALAAGRITPPQALALAQGSYRLPDEQVPEFERRLLLRAGDQTLPGLRQSIKRAVTILDPATAEERRVRAVAERHVRIEPAEDGMAWLLALLPAADALAIKTCIDGAARTAARSDDRTLDQLRADALINGILSGIDGEMPSEHGRRPSITVTVSLPTLVGRDQQPAWLDGYGPITAEYARRIAHDPSGTWRRLLTDPAGGQVLDYGRTRYRPPQHVVDHVIARDGQCTFPFCDRDARRSDLDHIEPYPEGPTAVDNLQPLHRRHHNAKTSGGWSAERDPTTGTTTWRSPHGRRYRSAPPERWSYPDPPPY